jgi:hypothetical protein
MKKTAPAAVALASVMALSGAAAAPAAAPAAPAAAAKATHTFKWKLHEIASHDLRNNVFVTADTIRSVKTGKIRGYDSVTGKFHPATNSARIQVAFSVRGGILVGQVHGVFSSNDAVFHGRIIRGTDKFQGVRGTITAKSIGDGTRTLVTIHYHH